ncbi:Pantoate-beta-alanine ligase [Fistulina hepatica ATCC 64428]|uniref:Pantoate--beta-alanine ligase n=1 Tax=Fistulina hepatica ATCC 64428 TaxID=1128425 RepID=A0A0D7AHZ8_9AGAR|nr:Pantoate-beta-alanine ligase [Fistulina hepatica ATCC 64428]
MSSLTASAAHDGQVSKSSIPVFMTVDAVRAWRRKAFDDKKAVGYVATMGALHEGHLTLVRRSLQENDLTIVSIFVNPAQFAPHEDLDTYPRTLPRDLELLSALGAERTVSAVFAPAVSEMYPSGISQDIGSQRGTFVEVKGYGDEVEGKSRPAFFRGVATVVMKLFNAIEPTQTYFGQKDIQQALLLRRMCRDMLLSHPLPANLHIVPTVRDSDGLALSSRNAYLSAAGRRSAIHLWQALLAAKLAWENNFKKRSCVARARELISEASRTAEEAGVQIRLDYIELNDSDSFRVLEDEETRASWQNARGHPVILSGALWVDRTRLIDNIILGDAHKII